MNYSELIWAIVLLLTICLAVYLAYILGYAIAKLQDKRK